MKKLLLTSLLFFPVSALAQDAIELDLDRDDPIEIERVVNGDVTAISPAALLFASFDTDGDYSVGEGELKVGTKAAFKRADADDSGTISIIEIENWRKAALGSRDAVPGRMAFDTDLDNRITSKEFKRTIGDLFKNTDKNDDGVLDFSEMVRVFDIPKRRANRPERRESAFSNDPRNRQNRR